MDLPWLPRRSLPSALSDRGGADGRAGSETSRALAHNGLSLGAGAGRWLTLAEPNAAATSVTQRPAPAASHKLIVPAVAVLVVLSGCDRAEDPTNTPVGDTRSFRIGFSHIPPSPNQTTAVASLEMWRKRADAAVMHMNVQWAAMLGGKSATDAARADALELANYYRSHDLPIVLMLDVTDGLARDKEAPELVAAGRSITEPAIQRLYRDYVVAIADVVRPTYIGLVAETNLIQIGRAHV